MAELVRWSWVENNLDDIQQASIEHLQLVGASMAIAIAISIPIAILVRRRRIPFIAVNTLSGALYTIPSLAMFAFLLSFVGHRLRAGRHRAGRLLPAADHPQHGGRPRRASPAPVREAAQRDGPDARQTLTRVELPLALPAIFAGIRLAAVSTVGIATIAVYIGAGGLGVLIVNDGIQRGLFVTPIVVGAAHRHGHGDRHRPRARRPRAPPDALAAGACGGGLMGDIWDAFLENDGWEQTWITIKLSLTALGLATARRAGARRRLRQGRARAAAFLVDHGLEPRSHRARRSPSSR